MLEYPLHAPVREGESEPAAARAQPTHWILVIAVLAFYVVAQLSLVIACREWNAIRAPESGLGFELLQTAAVATVAITLALIPFCGARPSRLLHALCWALIALGWTFRSVDWVVYYQSGLHINLMITSHSHADAVWLVLRSIPPVQLALPLVALALAILLERWSFARIESVTLAPSRLCVASGALLASLALASGSATKPRVEHATSGPEWIAYHAWRLTSDERRCRRDPVCAEQMNELGETIRRKLTRFGMHVDPRSDLPLFKPVVYNRALPFATTRPTGQRSNVLLVFMESMSAFFVNSYNPRTPSMTPELDAFAAESMRVENYYNATTPTVTSLTAALCSIHPPAGHDEFGPAFFGALHCLSDMLAPHGYKSTFVRGIGKEFANTGPFLESQQFKVLDMVDVQAELKEDAVSWGYSDHQLFRYLRTVLERDSGEQPFLLGMTTVDLHPPFNLTAVPEVLPGEEGRLFNIVHSTDHAFGEFWRWFKQSRFADNTIVVVTADHAVLPKPEYVQLRGADWEKSFFDRIPLFIHAPHLNLPRVLTPEIASSVDLTPTLLHLLHVNEPNSFEGISLFDDRRTKHGILGDHAFLFFSNQRGERGERVVDNFGLADCANEPPAPHTALLTRCEQQRWHEWKLRLIDQRRIWR